MNTWETASFLPRGCQLSLEQGTPIPHTHMELFQQSNTVSLLGLPAMKLYNSNVTVTQFLGSKGCFYLIKPAENKSLKYDRDFLLAISIYTLNQSSICQKSSLPNRNTHTLNTSSKNCISEKDSVLRNAQLNLSLSSIQCLLYGVAFS